MEVNIKAVALVKVKPEEETVAKVVDLVHQLIVEAAEEAAKEVVMETAVLVDQESYY